MANNKEANPTDHLKICYQKIIELEKTLNELIKRVERLEERRKEYDRKFKFLW